MSDAYLEQVEELKEDVRRMLTANANESSKKLRLTDLLQQLGVAYHFEREIEEALKQIHDSPNGFDEIDLNTMALQFHLLRQQGYNVPCDAFNRLKDSKGSFRWELIKDVSGMLCLYEASYMKVHGEDILDESHVFTTTQLKSLVNELKPPLATQVMHALKQPLHKGMPRLKARQYISVYQQIEMRNETLLKLAKLDFNLLQSIHQRELCQLSSWNISASDQLPEYMKVLYFALLNVYREVEEDLREEGKSYRVYYAIEEVRHP
ncbi:hypothetical protein NE237_014491 [Protea cynaroides]|uniref:Uncharacterized protein n=1 Tax=Protea cynaroides TaxID=273540 RepID=A0A9Q0KC83_9MAGN|nr:hypothetical protein NE237_014491 [Protea cynaroides]